MSSLDDIDLRLILNLETDLTSQTIDGFIHSIRERYSLTNSLYVCPSLPAPESSDPFVLTSYSENWVNHYRAERYVSIDPVYQVGARSLAPVDWSRLPRTNKKVRRLFDESRDAGVGRQGLTIPVRGPTSGAWGLFTVTSDETDAGWSARRHDLIRDLVHIAHYVHQRAYEMHVNDEPIDLNAITKREIEALEWAAEGHTIEDIARHMRIASATAKGHLDSARYKLQALNKVHAVTKAIRAGLIR